MRLLLCTLAIAGLMNGVAAGQAGGAPPRTFIVRLVESHSGKPVGKQSLNVYLGVGKEPGLSVDEYEAWRRAGRFPIYLSSKNGEAIIPVVPANSDTLSLVLEGSYIPCEPHAAGDPNLYFNVAQILSKGVVADNVCGKQRATPIPGVLIIFMKHRSRWQMG